MGDPPDDDETDDPDDEDEGEEDDEPLHTRAPSAAHAELVMQQGAARSCSRRETGLA